MEEKLREIIIQKINDTLSNADEIQNIKNSLGELSHETNAFSYGVVIGRLYNSFYYQCRRVLKRNPNEKEFLEFVEILKQKESEIKEKISF
ncbi:MAG: hypothetical protein ACE5R3_00050 [Nitrosopumilaceae archaeon]